MSDRPAHSVDCAIVGGGPAGMVLGLLLARRGVSVTVLEMHHDFDRDFRGDTVHASTMEVLDQIGLADAVLELPHTKMTELSFNAEGRRVPLIDLTHLKTRFPYITMMPQSVFLEFLRGEAEKYDGFQCFTGAAVRSLVERNGVTEGVGYILEGEERELRAQLVVACDGRFSRLRKLAGMEARAHAPPMDIAWFRIPRVPSDAPDNAGFYLGAGRILVLLERPESWQVGYVFPKGDFKHLKEMGLERFHASVAELAPWLRERVTEIADWREVHLLSIASDRLPCWHRPGMLFIGDAAHVMSPVGGVGINYAIGDAVEACNVLAGPLADGTVDESHLAEVQRRREGPTRQIQRFQSFMQRVVVERTLVAREFKRPWPLRIVSAIPGLRRIPPRIVALGFGRARLEQP